MPSRTRRHGSGGRPPLRPLCRLGKWSSIRSHKASGILQPSSTGLVSIRVLLAFDRFTTVLLGARQGSGIGPYLSTGDGNDTVNVYATQGGLYIYNPAGFDNTYVGAGHTGLLNGFVYVYGA